MQAKNSLPPASPLGWRLISQNAILNALARLHSADRTHAGQTAQLVSFNSKQKLSVGGLTATFPADKKWTASTSQMLDALWMLSVEEASHRDQNGTITFLTRTLARLLNRKNVKKVGETLRKVLALLTQTAIEWHGAYSLTLPQLLKSGEVHAGEVRLCWPERVWEMLAPKSHAAGKEKGKGKHRIEFFLTPYPLALLALDCRRQGIEAHAYYLGRKALVQKRANAGFARADTLKGQTLLDADPLIDSTTQHASETISMVSAALAVLTGDPVRSEADRKALFKTITVTQEGEALDLDTLKGRGALDTLKKANFKFEWATYPLASLTTLTKSKKKKAKKSL